MPVLRSANRNAGGAEGAYDFVPLFAHVEPLLNGADVAICHLETPVSADNTNLSQPHTLVFNSPHQLVDGLAEVGYDSCDFASNHMWDEGLKGLKETHQVFDRVGLPLAGPAANAADQDEAILITAGDVTVGHLAYGYTILNEWGPNTDVPPEAPWLEQSLWPAIAAEGIIADAHAARDAGAEFIVVSLHWGREYQEEPTTEQRDLAKELLEDGTVDLIIGTHVHVIQPCETINGRHVLYGLGNFLSNQSPKVVSNLKPGTQEGLVATVELTREPDGALTSTLEYQPTRVNLDGHVIELVTEDNYPETYARTTSVMKSLGAGACEATVANEVVCARPASASAPGLRCWHARIPGGRRGP